MRYLNKVVVLSLAVGTMFGQYGYRRPDPVNTTLNDLDRAGARAYVDHHERKHFDQARRDLLRFEDNFRRGKFDRGRLDSAIDNLNHLANSRQIAPRERETFYRDIQMLRDFRASGSSYGGYGYRGPRRY